MVVLGDYQAQNTAGFIFGCVLAPALVLVGVPLTYAIGRKGNDKFKYSLSSRVPKLLALWRLTCFVFGLVTLGYTTSGTSGAHIWALSYFTTWNWLLICMYFAVGLAVSGFQVCAPEKVPVVASDADAARLAGAERPRAVRVIFTLHHLFGEVCVPSALLVFLVVWAYLMPYVNWQDAGAFTNVAVHAMNVVMVNVDWALGAWRFNPKHFPLVGVWAGLYTCWHLIGNAAYGLMCYPFMQTDNSTSFILTSLALIVLITAFYFIYYGLDLVKHRFWSCCLVRPALLTVDDLACPTAEVVISLPTPIAEKEVGPIGGKTSGADAAPEEITVL